MSKRTNAVLESRDAKGVAKYLASGKCKKVVFMLGAGLSTSAGIPDFRSPKTGLYANLARLNLPYPEAVFEINYFQKNPVPFYTLAQELYPGKFRPTISHSFLKLIADRNILHTCYTQNIDTLERRAKVPADKIIEAHGSFAAQRCVKCKTPYDDGLMREKVKRCEVPRCGSGKCGGLVKPDIVFFGEALPGEFMEALPTMQEADLLIIIGTSLTVHPFASIAELVTNSCPRVLINLDRVGSIGRRPNDLVLLGQCDEIVRDICREAGWLKQLETLWESTKYSVEDWGNDEVEEASLEGAEEAKVEGDGSSKAEDEDKMKEKEPLTADKEVEKLTEAIVAKLVIPPDTKEEEASTKIESREDGATVETVTSEPRES